MKKYDIELKLKHIKTYDKIWSSEVLFRRGWNESIQTNLLGTAGAEQSTPRHVAGVRTHPLLSIGHAHLCCPFMIHGNSRVLLVENLCSRNAAALNILSVPAFLHRFCITQDLDTPPWLVKIVCIICMYVVSSLGMSAIAVHVPYMCVHFGQGANKI